MGDFGPAREIIVTPIPEPVPFPDEFPEEEPGERELPERERPELVPA
jgi:hypothetical protein